MTAGHGFWLFAGRGRSVTFSSMAAYNRRIANMRCLRREVMVNCRKQLVGVGFVVWTCLGSSGAAPLRSRDVSAEARWVVHVDAERLQQVGVGQYLFSEVLSVEPHAGRLAAFQRISGLDLRKEIRSMTLYGKDAEEGSGVAVIRGDFARSTLVDLVRLNEGYENIAYGALSIHKWSDHGRDHYGCLLDAQILVVGRRLETVQGALDVLRNAAPHLAADSDLLGLVPSRAAVILIASAQGLQDMPGLRPQAAMLKNSRRLAFVAGEENSQLFIDVCFEAQTAEAADQMAAVVRGMLAYGALSQEQTPVLARLAQRAQVAVEGPLVKVSLLTPVTDLVESLRQVREQRRQGTGTPSL